MAYSVNPSPGDRLGGTRSGSRVGVWPEFDSSVGAWARNSVIFQGFRACDGIAPCA